MGMPHQSNPSSLWCAAEESHSRIGLLELLSVLDDGSPRSSPDGVLILVKVADENSLESRIDIDHFELPNLDTKEVIWAKQSDDNQRFLEVTITAWSIQVYVRETFSNSRAGLHCQTILSHTYIPASVFFPSTPLMHVWSDDNGYHIQRVPES